MPEDQATASESDTAQYHLPATPSPESLEGFHSRLLELREKPLSLVASGVTRINAPLLQLIVAAKADWASRDVSFEIVDPSDAFTETATLLGIPDDFLSFEEAA